MKHLIYQHLGLGDHLICNGLVREICASVPEDSLEIITKPTHFNTVNFMYRDVKNLKTVALKSGNFAIPENGQEVLSYAQSNNQQILKIGHEFMRRDINFDKSFYAQFDFDFKNRWDSFKVDRDLEAEKRLIDKLNIKGKYIFVHEDAERGMSINRKTRDGKFRVISASTDLSNNMFDYLSLIEGASEIHVIESSFMFLIDSFQIAKPLFAHRYARNYPSNNTPTLKLDWNILI